MSTASTTRNLRRSNDPTKHFLSDRVLFLLVLGVCLCIVVGCSSQPGVAVPIGYQAGIEYPASFRVVASDTGPPTTQGDIAETLIEVLQSKGLTSSETPGVVFSLHWSATDSQCDASTSEQQGVGGSRAESEAESEAESGGCVQTSPDDQPLIRAHLQLQAHATADDALIWQADFRGFRRIPLNSPALAQIREMFVPAFTQALADYPGVN
jgi:hypothetical protein